MNIARIDLNGDGKIDWVAWELRCDANICSPEEVQVKIAVPLEGQNRTHLVPIQKLRELKYYDQMVVIDDRVDKRKGDIDRVVYGFSFRLEKREPVFSDEILRWGLQLCLKVKPMEVLSYRKASVRRLGVPIFHPDLFRMPKKN